MRNVCAHAGGAWWRAGDERAFYLSARSALRVVHRRPISGGQTRRGSPSVPCVRTSALVRPLCACWVACWASVCTRRRGLTISKHGRGRNVPRWRAPGAAGVHCGGGRQFATIYPYCVGRWGWQLWTAVAFGATRRSSVVRDAWAQKKSKVIRWRIVHDEDEP